MLTIFTIRKFSSLILFSLLLTKAGVPSLFGNPSSSPSKEITVELIVVSPIDKRRYFNRFGHLALAVSQEEESMRIYDFGTFLLSSFYILHSLKGRVITHALVSGPNYFYSHFQYDTAEVRVHTLNLPPDGVNRLLEALEKGVAPENAAYLYHFFEDNCATRIRDLIDSALDGQLKKQTTPLTKGLGSYRRQVNRYMGPDYATTLLFWLFSIVTGPSIDRPINRWQAMFLPETVEEAFLNFHYEDEEGRQIPLVTKTIIAKEAPGGVWQVPSRPLHIWARGLLIGSLLGALFLWFYRCRMTKKLYRIQLILAGFLGILGLITVLYQFSSYGEMAHGNINLILYNPLFLVLLPTFSHLGKLHKQGKLPKSRWQKLIPFSWDLFAGMGIVLFLINLFSLYPQKISLPLAVVWPVLFSMSQTGRYLVDKSVRYFERSR